MECDKISVKRQIYTNTDLPLETRQTSNKQSILTYKTTRRRRRQQQKKQTQQKERSNKDQSRNILRRNGDNTKDQIKSWFFERKTELKNHQPDLSKKKGKKNWRRLKKK